MSARSIAEGKEVMSELASISARLADVKAQQSDLTGKRAELEEEERELFARWAKLFAAEAGVENPVDLRTKQRRRRVMSPRKVDLTNEDRARAAEVAADLEEKRRLG
jgi:phage terminase Nu1 subunit (DNA packaging protein)